MRVVPATGSAAVATVAATFERGGVLHADAFTVVAGQVGSVELAWCRERAVRALNLLDGRDPTETSSGWCHIMNRGRSQVARGSATMVTGTTARLSIRFEESPDQVIAGTDSIGLSTLCWAEVEGVTVVSTSALIVAAIIDAELDAESVAMLGLLGFLVGGRTLFRGVRRLEAGESVTIRKGQPTVCERSSRDRGPLAAPNPNGSDIVGRVVGELDEEFPDAVLELSGGIDSRAVLAALPQVSRPGRMAVTLGAPGDPDVRVARMLARGSDLDLMVIDPRGELSALPPEVLRDRVLDAARRRDHVFNVFAAAALDHAERRIPAGPRFTGANGEYARGFYYPGAGPDGRVTERRVAWLTSWRLFANDGTASASLQPELVATATASIRSVLLARLAGSGSWRGALDEFYLTGRMANWAGPSYSVRRPDSPALGPFFHPDFLAWARSLPRRSRVRDQQFARMVCELDPQLGGAELDRGVTPRQMASTGGAETVRRTLSFVDRAARKARQRIMGRSRPPSLSASLHGRVRTGLQTADMDALSSSRLFREDFLDGLASGSVTDASTLSLALNVSGARRFLAELNDSSPADASSLTAD